MNTQGNNNYLVFATNISAMLFPTAAAKVAADSAEEARDSDSEIEQSILIF